ncbi:hypothetical protein SMICM304S_00350 [Streptomyces microflavus]
MTSEERRVPPTARIAEFPKRAADQARWWEGHILEVLHGLPPDAPHGAVPRPEFDPRQCCLAERERAKAAELTAAGHRMTASGVKQRRQRYQRDGLVGLADGRSAKKLPDFGQISPLVVEAMRQAIAETTDASSRTVRFTIWRTKEILASRDDAAGIELPTERTLYRLFDKLAVGTHATGSARTRRSLLARPAGPFGEVPAIAPGELMQIDSTPLDVLVRLDDGIAEKVELTALVDIASRSITAAVLRPTTKAADASALLARSITPETMRPGWPQALRMSRSVMPHRRLLALDERLEQAAARPVIVPETIVCDHGKVFISHNFRASCRFLGVSLQPTHKASPFEKGVIEKTLGSVATLFAQFVAGYTGPQPSFLYCYLCGPPQWFGRPLLEHLATTAGHSPEALERALADANSLGGISRPRRRLPRRNPFAWRQDLAHHIAQEALRGTQIRTLVKRHNLRCWDVRFALEVPRLTAAETSQLTDPITGELADLVEGMIGRKLNGRQIWTELMDHHDYLVTYDSLRHYIRYTRPRTASVRAGSLASNPVAPGQRAAHD